MTFEEMLDQAIAMLRRQRRVAYRTLQVQFNLDDNALEALKDELLYAQQVAQDEDGRVLLWTGGADIPPSPSPHAITPAPQPPIQKAAFPQTAPRPVISSTPEAERRQLTVLFCDLVDSTMLASQLDPEDLHEVVRAYQEVCTKVVARFEGHIAQYLGDGLLVYFDYPHAHEDDVQRAVRAGLGMIEAVGQLNTRLAQERGVQLAVRLGIHTGLVVVGEMGGGSRHEQLALGDTPNLAARLEDLAAPNTLVISAATLPLLGGFFVCQSLGTSLLKGFAQPLEVYQILYESMARSRLEAAGGTGLTPLVGREQEVGLLLERWAQVKDGLGQVVLLSGNAGIGKSRLVHVLKEQVASEPQAWLTPCQCSPYHQNTALYPLIDLLERVVLRFDRNETPQQKLNKLEGHIVQYGLPLAETVPLLASLLSLPPPVDYTPLSMSPEQQKQQTMHVLLTTLLKIAAQQPMLFVMEDLHWGDPTTLEFLTLLVDQGPTARILALLTFRPDFSPPLDGAFAPPPGDPAALAAAPGHPDDGPGGPRQGAPARGRGAGGGQDGWRTAVRRGVDQDGAGVRPPPGAGGRLRTHRSPAPAGDSLHPARLADGAAGPPGHREEPGATRGHPGARVCVCLAARRVAVGRGDPTAWAAPVGAGGVCISAGAATAGDVPL